MNQEQNPGELGDSKEAVVNAEETRRKALACWYLTGATAGGKTRIGLELARLLDAEIISLDSMAIYRGMDIGTAKPSAEHQQRVPHHLIDIVDPVESFSVSQYLSRAVQAIDEIRGRGKQVLFVGGTALYLKALLRGLFDGPPADWDFREQIEQELAHVESAKLHERLQMVDPVSAHKLHPNDRRRIIRALEVYRSTGKPISHWQMEFDQATAPCQCKVFTIRHARDILHERIETRVDWMFEHGLVQEVESLLERWKTLGHTAAQAVGYREVAQYLGGEMEMDETIERVRVRTRRFARHQETWFRGMEECRMIDLAADYDESKTAQALLEIVASDGPGD
ncbi:MAG: tRNA (adenosine(37)-N6)-dimethylallyltransferase MiaA [Mariniblastus sp.]|nr:tRNA (adenosine(37)-N6)-dimethylallyltransferase MiaA [Mariniblastus sp.]